MMNLKMMKMIIQRMRLIKVKNLIKVLKRLAKVKKQ